LAKDVGRRGTAVPAVCHATAVAGVAVVLLVSVAILAVGRPAQAARSPHHGKAGGALTVFAAASLKEAFTTIGAQFAVHDRARVTFNFGGSDELVTQIAQGAPADVFASANLLQMKIAQDKGLIASKPAVFARNRLVVIVPRNNPGRVYRLPDLGRPGVRLVLAAPQVPVGKYARAALAAMARAAAFGPHFLARVIANVVSNETDVKAVVAKVVLGEADAGVVYVTDVTAQVAPRVHTIAIPARFNQIARYPIAVVAGSRNPVLARTFVAYVLSPAGQSVLRRSGFIPGVRGLALGARGPLTTIPYRLSPIAYPRTAAVKGAP
jgi:molybdate transport system substrate-binding protein